MQVKPFPIALAGALLTAGAAVLATASETPQARPQPVTPEAAKFFETSIRPVLATRCEGCHGAARQSGGLRLDSQAALLKGGVTGPALVPGKPETSLLLRALSHQDPRLKMPPGGQLPARQLADFEQWVRMGAPWGVSSPDAKGPSRAKAGRLHWSFQPVRQPALPKVKNAAWVRTPIDAFVLAELEKHGLQPSPPADPRTLIRRATFDLTGLPPTPAEVEAFVRESEDERTKGRVEERKNGSRPNPTSSIPPSLRSSTPSPAYARLIDRLLASSAYGERWGRHWLDVARYADSNGLDENVAHGNAWRYRDWVVRSFNEDKPYNQFVLEQLAGDLLPTEDTPTRYARLTATGFLALGPKVLAEPDKEKMVMDIVDEQIDTTGRAFMGLTLGCARCHDHKFDPVSTEDYYALAGIFKSTRSMESLQTVARWWENPIPAPEDLQAQAAHQKQVTELETQIKTLVERGKAEVTAGGAAPANPETAFKPELQAELKGLRDRLAEVKKNAPELPSAMGVTEGSAVDVAVHIRGDHQHLGRVVPRRFPVFLAGTAQAPLQPKSSGRLELAQWLTRPDHPLTARVAVNRVWRWHFGRGLVPSTDNFGLLGEKPSHPELLDWLAARFAGVESLGSRVSSRTSPDPGLGTRDAGLTPWSLKSLHRLIMLSSTYQQSSAPRPQPQAADPENRLFWRANLRRLEAEELRDSMLAVSGLLDRTMGGSLLHVKNHQFFFDHTSKDGTRYDSKRRALYLPVVRNNVYDLFQLFDFGDPAVLESSRHTTTVAPQALFWLNSSLVGECSDALARAALERPGTDDSARLRELFGRLYGRVPGEKELARSRAALSRLEQGSAEADPARRRAQAWSWYCQTLLAANEFSYLR